MEAAELVKPLISKLVMASIDEKLVFTSTPVKTVTPAPVTATVTNTATATSTFTAPTNTDTITTTTTNTITDTSTEVTTVPSTVFTTSTVVSTSTSTSATPAGFTPISQEPGYVPKIKGRDALALEPRAAAPSSCKASFPKGAKSPVYSPALYPTAVVCAKLVETISTKTATYTASTTKTTTLVPVTQTTTSTTTTTVTTTFIPPGVTETATATTSTTTQVTTTSTTTSVTTVTATQTSIVPGPTYYAACDSNNIINSANGGQFITQVSAAGDFTQTSSSSPYDCCAACQQTAGCRGSYYGGGTFCVLAAGGACTPGQFRQYDEFNTDSTGTADLAFYVSNGPCGLIRNAGSVG
ncbi:MAG: hypothetical protein Q9195_008601 [Heterodermia aff. obscurata]